MVRTITATRTADSVISESTSRGRPGMLRSSTSTSTSPALTAASASRASLGFGDHLEVGYPLEEHAQPPPDDDVVVGKDKGDPRLGLFHRRRL